jgi:uncharacterized membrane protein
MHSLSIFLRGEKRNTILLLSAMSFFCFALTLFRWHLCGKPVFLFINWNLFLAAIPWALSSIVVANPKLKHNGFALVALVLAWLVFFPNSPYILTDLLHLRAMLGVPCWYDLLMILSFAWTGLLFGFLSLRDMETLLTDATAAGA